jgi:hypothetical protein
VWQRLVNLNVSWDFDDLGKVMRNRASSAVDVTLAGE